MKHKVTWSIGLSLLALSACTEKREQGDDASASKSNTEIVEIWGEEAQLNLRSLLWFAPSDRKQEIVLTTKADWSNGRLWTLSKDELLQELEFRDTWISALAIDLDGNCLLAVGPPLLITEDPHTQVISVDTDKRVVRRLHSRMPGMIWSLAQVDRDTLLVVRRSLGNTAKMRLELVHIEPEAGAPTDVALVNTEVPRGTLVALVAADDVVVSGDGTMVLWPSWEFEDPDWRWVRSIRRDGEFQIDESGSLPEYSELVGILGGRPLWIGPENRTVWLDGEQIHAVKRPLLILQVAVLTNGAIVVLCTTDGVEDRSARIEILNRDGELSASRNYNGMGVPPKWFQQRDVWSAVVLYGDDSALAVVCHADGDGVSIREQWIVRGADVPMSGERE